MEDFRVMFWPFSVPIVAIVGWVTYMIIATLSRHRLRELEIRERIAMIERGLVPPPDVDPRGFDRVMNRVDRHESRYGSGRHRRAGITIMGVGFGLMLMIGFAGEEPAKAIGVGGFLVILGLAFFVNSLFDNRLEPPAPSSRSFGAPNSTPGPIDSPRHD
jgi:hypothetical protein